ncbi:hypothetical protein [Desertimonas flava]|uniref:hypothetical protein n=1 Tax=Desertimonas flava TaxID=2064846 RepID=UPI003C6C07B8
MRLYTYADDLVLDPFMGSGSTVTPVPRMRRADPTMVKPTSVRRRSAVLRAPCPSAATVPASTAASVAAAAVSAAVDVSSMASATRRRAMST